LSISTRHTSSGLQIPRWLSLGLIVVIFVAALIYARAQGAIEARPLADGRSPRILVGDEQLAAKIDGDATK
jgi:hypothetical protein